MHRGVSGRRQCGATIISDRWLLTAAHCTYDFQKGSAFVGFTDITDWFTHKVYGIRTVINHPYYSYRDKTTYANDIALVMLTESIVFTKDIQPICLPSSDSFFSTPLHTGYVTGWGYFSLPQNESALENGVDAPLHNQQTPHHVRRGLSDRLLQAEVPYIDTATCR
uniref:Peptidase S1 domain-containing protein n=1 Tax=Plectus sambesii TaxID=2011161 RepID=A0A914W576_9BILA